MSLLSNRFSSFDLRMANLALFLLGQFLPLCKQLVKFLKKNFLIEFLA